MSNIHKGIRFVHSDGLMVAMIRLILIILIENDVIPMALLVQKSSLLDQAIVHYN